MMSPKIALVFGVGAGLTVAMVEIAAGVGLTGQPILDGLLGGTGITLLTLGMYKAKFDRVVEDVRGKADAQVVEKQFALIERTLERIENHLLNR